MSRLCLCLGLMIRRSQTAENEGVWPHAVWTAALLLGEEIPPLSALAPPRSCVGCLRVPWGLQCEGTGARREGGLRSEHSGPPFLVLEPELEGFWTTPCALVLTSVLLLVLSGRGRMVNSSPARWFLRWLCRTCRLGSGVPRSP